MSGEARVGARWRLGAAVEVPRREDAAHADDGRPHRAVLMRASVSYTHLLLKRYVSWVQNVARQFGPYLWWA